MGVIPELGLAEEIPTGNTMWCKPPPRAPSALVMLPEMACLQPPVGVNYFDIQSAGEDKTIEVGQFVYLLLNNRKIRNILQTITSKVVLLLGRFTSERKALLDRVRDQLRQMNFSPVPRLQIECHTMSDTRSEIPGVSLGILVNEKLFPNEVNLALKLIEGMPAELARSR